MKGGACGMLVFQQIGSLMPPTLLALGVGGGVGGVGNMNLWNGEIWFGENLAPNLRYHWKIWEKSPDGSTRTHIIREWWLSFPMRLWLVAENSWRPQDGCRYFLDPCCYFLEASGWLRVFPRGFWELDVISGWLLGVLKMTPKKITSGLKILRHILAHFCCS